MTRGFLIMPEEHKMNDGRIIDLIIPIEDRRR